MQSDEKRGGRTRREIDEQLVELMAELLGISVEQIQKSDRLTEELGADSLVELEMIIAVEDLFKIEIPDEDAKTLDSVMSYQDYIWKALNGTSE